MKLKLLENPSIYYRGDNALVIFPKIPYWFAASKEISTIIKSFSSGNLNEAIFNIKNLLNIELKEAEMMCSEVIELLYEAGVMEVNEKSSQLPGYTPDYQVNDVENVLVIATTQACNLSCPMCYAVAGKAMKSEMSTEQIIAIVDQLNQMPWDNKISRVALTGGELFLRKDALDLIEYVHNEGFFVQINSNATLFNDLTIERLSKLSRLKLSISLDGCTADTHELIRGRNTFDRTIRNIELLCNKNISVAVNMFVHAGNLSEIKNTLILAKNLGAVAFNCLNLMNVGRGNDAVSKQNLAPVNLSEFYRQIYLAIKDDQDLQRMMFNSTFANQVMGIAAGVKSHSCGIGTNRAIYVKPDGSLYPCADTALPEFKLGNLLNDDLKNIWLNSDLLSNLRSIDIDSMNSQCKACDLRYMCAGNCRGENYQTIGDLYKPHFKCQEIHDSILELMWILSEDPDIFKQKVVNLYDTVNNHATSA
jgi:radical SAM protein with 4Fe4S-binding SPASM domain